MMLNLNWPAASVVARRFIGSSADCWKKTSAPAMGLPASSATIPATVMAGFITITASKLSKSVLETSPGATLSDAAMLYMTVRNSAWLKLSVSDLKSGGRVRLVHLPAASVVTESASSSVKSPA